MANALIKDVPVEAGLKFGAVVGLDLLSLEGQPGQHVVEDWIAVFWSERRIGPQDAQPGAVVDRGVLVVAFAAS